MTNPPVAGQVWNADHYRAHAGFVSTLGADVLAWLAPEAGESILDLGCGEGALTEVLVQSGAQVLGLEPDADFARSARSRGLEVVEQDAHDPFGEAAFDAIFSNAVLHWVRDPECVFKNAHDALRPGGRFVAEQGGFGNVAAVVTALNASRAKISRSPVFPWYFPSVSRQTKTLEGAGFEVDRIALIPRPTALPTGMNNWLVTFAAPFLTDLPNAQHEELLADAEDRLGALHDPEEGWTADYVRLRFEAHKPLVP